METRTQTVAMVLACILVAVPLAAAQAQPPSVLQRLLTVDDPELGELIRIAIDNRRSGYAAMPEEELKIIRDVTEAYARITLLDRQIEQTDYQISQMTSPVREEMMLAKAELETKRTVELANLRQVMGIIPRHAFGRRPENELKTWLLLDMIEDKAIIVYAVRSEGRTIRSREYSLVGVMTPAEALDRVTGVLRDKDGLPLRVDIRRTPDTADLSSDIYGDLMNRVRIERQEMNAEMHLEPVATRRDISKRFFVLDNQVGNGLDTRDGLPHLGGILEPNDVVHEVNELVKWPEQLPATIELEYYAGSEATVDRLVQTIEERAEQLGIAEFIQVKRTLRPSDPAWAYLGRWECRADDWTSLLIIEPNQAAQHIRTYEGRDPGVFPGHWSITDEHIVMEFGQITMTGRVNESGNLVFDDSEAVFIKKQD